MSASPNEFGPPTRATYYLATLAPVSRQDLDAFVEEAGWKVHIVWVTDEKAAWLRRLDALPRAARVPRLTTEAHDALARMTDILGAPPHDFVELSPRGEEGQEVAAAFVEAFAERWAPFALESAYPLDAAEGGRKVWTMDEVLVLARTEHRLPGLRTGIPNWFAYVLELYRAEQAEEAARRV